jgi:hypothetical protein
LLLLQEPNPDLQALLALLALLLLGGWWLVQIP